MQYIIRFCGVNNKNDNLQEKLLSYVFPQNIGCIVDACKRRFLFQRVPTIYVLEQEEGNDNSSGIQGRLNHIHGRISSVSREHLRKTGDTGLHIVGKYGIEME